MALKGGLHRLPGSIRLLDRSFGRKKQRTSFSILPNQRRKIILSDLRIHAPLS
jgi:hypothetical protein